MAELDRPHVTPVWLRRSALALWALTASACLAITAYYLLCHTMSPLSRDQWHMLDALFTRGILDTSLGTVSGHRHLLAFWLYDIDLRVFNGQNHFLQAVDWLLNGTLITLLCTQAWRLPLSTLARTLYCSWIIVLLCWLLNIALIGWGFNGINNFMSIVPGLLSVYCLHQAVHQRTLAAAVAAGLLGILATLSFANGVLVWPTAFICLFLWRAPRTFVLSTLIAATLAVTAYLVLPGADAARETLKAPGLALLTFPVQVMGGPLYHLLRSWHLASDAILTPLASLAGTLITTAALTAFIRLCRQRPPMLPFQSLCVALMCFGAGSCLMLSMSRLDEFLDFTVDRFQIFALLVWIGASGLWLTQLSPAAVRRFEMLFVLFPLLALPSQLDWGARLAEYRNRVDASLLAYQVYLPVRDDAEKALHWNWENKLPAFFHVLEYLRAHQLNIFHGSPAGELGQSQPAVSTLPACELQIVRSAVIHADELLDLQQPSLASVAATEHYRFDQHHTDAATPVGQRWYLDVQDRPWDHGMLLDAQDIVRGLVIPMRVPALPRSSGVRERPFNAYAVQRLDAPEQAAIRLVLLHAQQPVCALALAPASGH